MASNKKKSNSKTTLKTKTAAKPKSAAKAKAKAVAKPKTAAKAKTKTAAKGNAKSPAKAKVANKKMSKAAKTTTTKTAAKAATKTATTTTARTATKATGKGFVTPLHDHVLVRQEGASDRTPGGLYIPTMVQDKPQQGKVLAVGKGAFSKKGKLRPLDVKVGETVLFGPYAGNKITVEGDEVLVLKEDEILGVIPR